MSQQRDEVSYSERRLRCRYRLLGDLGLRFLRGNVSFVLAATFRARLFLLPIPYCLFPNPYSPWRQLDKSECASSPTYVYARSLIPRKDFVIKRIGTKINGTNKRKKGAYVEKSEFGIR